MVHGWPQLSFCWRKLAALLIPHYRVIALDLRGCGDSETVPGGFDKKTLAADIAALVHYLGLEAVVIAGHDWGGPIAYRFALDNHSTTLAVIILNGRMPLLARHAELMHAPQQVRERWYFNFNLVPELPEKVIGRSLQEFLHERRRARRDDEVVLEMDRVIQVITAIRNIRGEMNLLPGERKVQIRSTLYS